MAAAAVVGLLAVAVSSGPAMAEGGGLWRGYAATVTVEPDGTLEVVETFVVDTSGSVDGGFAFEREIVTREPYDETSDRVYEVTDVAVTSTEAELDVESASTDDAVQVEVSGSGADDTSVALTFTYRVAGAVSATQDGLEVRWPVVQGIPVVDADVTWNAPGVLWLSCLVGPPGSSKPCTSTQLGDGPSPTMTQLGLDDGDRMVGILGLSADSGVSADIDLRERWSLANAFTASGGPLLLALGVLALGLVFAFLLWWTRGRDTDDGTSDVFEPLVDVGDGRLVVSPPGAVRPGQMGTLVDEHADVVDVSATVIDLATRNYLFIEEIPRGAHGRMDWRLRCRNEPGDELLAYEREVFASLFGDADSVLVSELDDNVQARLSRVQALMYDDMVKQGWFAERPDAVRGRWTTAGWVLVAAGVVLTVVLAAATTYGLVGLALVLAGVALAVAGQLAPARTSAGSTLLRGLTRFRAYLATADPTAIPPAQGEEVISRLFAYALVFGLAERWADGLAALDADADPDDPLYWYGASSDWHLSDAGPSMVHLVAALNAAIGARRLLAD